MQNKSNLIKLFLLCALGSVLIWIWLKFLDINSFRENFRNANFGLLVVALTIFFSSMFIKSFRWNLIINQVQPVKFMTSFWILVTGNLINYIIPLRFGEVVKIALLKKKVNMPVGSSLATIIADKMSDLSMVVWALLLIPTLNLDLSHQLWVGLIIIACMFSIGLVTIVILLIFDRKITVALTRYSGRNKLILFWINFILKLTEAFTILKLKPSIIFYLILITMLILIVDASKVYVLYAAFGHKIPPLAASFGSLVRYLFFAIPMPPAQIGSVELIWLMIYSGLFATKIQLVNSVSVSAHSISILTNLILGTLGMLITGVNISNIMQGNNSHDA